MAAKAKNGEQTDIEIVAPTSKTRKLTNLPSRGRPKRIARAVPSVQEALKHLEAASGRDLNVARLTMGLFQTLLGWDPSTLFPGFRGSLVHCSEFPDSLKKDVQLLVECALAARSELFAVLASAISIEDRVRKLRNQSILGMRLRRQAKRIMEQNGPVLREKWEPAVETFPIVRDEIGKPLNEGIISKVVAFGGQRLEIVGHYDNALMSAAPGTLTIRINEDGYTVEDITLTVRKSAQPKDPAVRNFEGELIDYFETGTEGTIWMLADDKRYGREGLELISEGDHLTILGPLGKELWSGTIRCDKKVGWRSYPKNPQYGQQCALGRWVHWIQRGFKPDRWAGFFMRADYDRYRGVLVRAPKKGI